MYDSRRDNGKRARVKLGKQTSGGFLVVCTRRLIVKKTHLYKQHSNQGAAARSHADDGMGMTCVGGDLSPAFLLHILRICVAWSTLGAKLHTPGTSDLTAEVDKRLELTAQSVVAVSGPIGRPRLNFGERAGLASGAGRWLLPFLGIWRCWEQ